MKKSAMTSDVVYLNQLRLEDARFEFLTAMELNQSNQLAGR